MGTTDDECFSEVEPEPERETICFDTSGLPPKGTFSYYRFLFLLSALYLIFASNACLFYRTLPTIYQKLRWMMLKADCIQLYLAR